LGEERHAGMRLIQVSQVERRDVLSTVFAESLADMFGRGIHASQEIRQRVDVDIRLAAQMTKHGIETLVWLFSACPPEVHLTEVTKDSLIPSRATETNAEDITVGQAIREIDFGTCPGLFYKHEFVLADCNCH
jgi:hypothetical protein